MCAHSFKRWMSHWTLPIAYFSKRTKCFGNGICFRPQVKAWRLLLSCVRYNEPTSITRLDLKLAISNGPITVAARSKSWTVFAPSNAGIVDSKPTQCMDVCVCLYSVFVLYCIGSGLETGWSPAQGDLRVCIGLRNWKSGQGPTKGYRAIDK
jgi:hypothetical protein